MAGKQLAPQSIDTLLNCPPAGTALDPASTADDQARALGALLAATEQLVQDLADDADVYQEAFPQRCAISLPAISCRCLEGPQQMLSRCSAQTALCSASEQHASSCRASLKHVALPAWNRVYCQNLRPNLQRMVASGLTPNQTVFDLLEAVRQLELQAMRWCPSVLGGHPGSLHHCQWRFRKYGANEKHEPAVSGIHAVMSLCSLHLLSYYGALGPR